MIYECSVYCHSVTTSMDDILGPSGVPDNGKWLPFAVDISLVDACKMASDESDDITYKTTTLFMQNGDNYVIDTYFKDFVKLWKQYREDEDIIDDNNDLEL